VAPVHWRVLDRAVEHDLAGRKLRAWSAEDLIVDLKTRDRPTDITAILALLVARKGAPTWRASAPRRASSSPTRARTSSTG